jgi:uncharacterized protein YdaU (DUF1376 family)/DNA-binding transcriptional MerR regulator
VRLFPDDFLGGTMHMDCRQVGQYMLLLCAQWGAQRGAERSGVRGGAGALRAILRGEEIDPVVREKFQEVMVSGVAYLRNSRMSEEIENSVEEYNARVRGAERIADRPAEHGAERPSERSAGRDVGGPITTTTTTSTTTATATPTTTATDERTLSAEPTVSRPKPDPEAEEALAHWQAVSATNVKSPKVRAGILRRARARLDEGLSVADLKAAVDGAAKDPWWAAKLKDPVAVWKDFGRVRQLGAALAPVPIQDKREEQRLRQQQREIEERNEQLRRQEENRQRRLALPGGAA